MDLKVFDAAGAYGAALGRAGAPGLGSDAASSIGKLAGSGTSTGFGAMVESLIEETGNAVSKAESISAQAIAGQADIVDVVTAISNAEMVLETVTTVRDRVISAYQEIMRMPI